MKEQVVVEHVTGATPIPARARQDLRGHGREVQEVCRGAW